MWARVKTASNGMYTVNIIEKQAMKQDVVASVAVMAGSLKPDRRGSGQKPPGTFFNRAEEGKQG
jgi:hypothetical protein